MNTVNYILHYLTASAHVGFEESYWRQVFYNDLWVKVLGELNK